MAEGSAAVGAGKGGEGLEAVVGLGFSSAVRRGQAHRRGRGTQGVAEDSGEKLSGTVYGSSEPSGCPKRLLKMDRPVRPSLASLSDFQFGAVTTETIEDALLHLAQQNEQAVRDAAGRPGSFRETRIVGVDAGRGAGSVGDRGPGPLSLRHRPGHSVYFIHSNKLC